MDNTIVNNPILNNYNTDITNKLNKKDYQNDNLDKDAFLKLLVTELRHQDPTQPMENKEFIAQMAQFSTLEQMTNVNKSIQILNRSFRSNEAYSLLGKKILGFDPAAGTKIEGNVTGMYFKGNDVKLIVNGKELGLNDIYAVFTNNQSDVNKSEE